MTPTLSENVKSKTGSLDAMLLCQYYVVSADAQALGLALALRPVWERG